LDRNLPLIETEIFAIDKPYTTINFPEEGGVTGYFGRNLTKADLDLVKDFLNEQKVNPLNTRAFKHADGHFEVTVGSLEESTQ